MFESLVDHYIAANIENGHARNCCYGAGADCDCERSRAEMFVVVLTIHGGAQLIAGYSERKDRMVDMARAYARGNWPAVKLWRRVYERRSESFDRFLRAADEHIDRLHDWATDFAA